MKPTDTHSMTPTDRVEKLEALLRSALCMLDLIDLDGQVSIGTVSQFIRDRASLNDESLPLLAQNDA